MKEDEQDVLHVCKWGQNGIILEITKKKRKGYGMKSCHYYTATQSNKEPIASEHFPNQAY